MNSQSRFKLCRWGTSRFLLWLGLFHLAPLKNMYPETWGCRLAWFRIRAWGVRDPGFKSQQPHHPTPKTEIQSWLNCLSAEPTHWQLTKVYSPRVSFLLHSAFGRYSIFLVRCLWCLSHSFILTSIHSFSS